jgi:hypothetical protein
MTLLNKSFPSATTPTFRDRSKQAPSNSILEQFEAFHAERDVRVGSRATVDDLPRYFKGSR